ncbi:hypothetical protein LZD49_12230 [Dyadobacter sp. CY261]|uniref:hypothetical protein n=1 Tax=Dyadobacter sp. CY261 TaxID=2907203 RepID=UPI001F1752F4|nr:hypothetical protein [Dyadobacter sp. CY261]MCF0071240.1 hypothetical protein [Dyadobacter sp. CY261]
MKDICNIWVKGLVRLVIIPGLTFFVCLISCNPKPESREIRVRWENEQAISIVIPASLTQGIPDDSASKAIVVSLAGQPNPVAIFGAYTRDGAGLLFTPLIPFTRGMHYDVRIRGKLTRNFEIPENNTGNVPAVTAIYPSADTLPENLLKIYLHFDRPMREGVSGTYVKLVKNQRDTVDGAFLDLQPELWNPERTVLTLWLDPGRIKRDLQPNKRLGAPMQSGTHYHVVVSPEWPDVRSKKLVKSYGKTFVTLGKDSLSPQLSEWKLSLPARSTKQPLTIDFNESLDHSLLQEVFVIQKTDGDLINGKWEIRRFEKQCSFIPNTTWEAGAYKLVIQTRLEDLAGNNLNRPFDRDVSRQTSQTNGAFSELRFMIK